MKECECHKDGGGGAHLPTCKERRPHSDETSESSQKPVETTTIVLNKT